MIEEFKLDNVTDFNQRYKNTWGFYLGEQGTDKKLIFIRQVARDKVEFDTENDKGFFSTINSGIKYEFLPITRGWVYVDKESALYFLQRIPARQYQRGISSGNTACWHIDSTQRFYPVPLSFPVLSSLFLDKSKITIEDFLNEKVSSFPLSLEFAVHRGCVYFYDKKIGKYETGKIMLDTDFVYQELSDCISRKKYPLSLEIFKNV